MKLALALAFLFSPGIAIRADPGLDHRMAVITFGSAPRVDVSFTPVRSGGLPRLYRRLGEVRAEDRGDTDVLAALASAEKLFRALPPDPSRRRAIVMLTDGVPYVRGADMSAYRVAVQRFIATRLVPSRITFDALLRASQVEVLARAHGIVTALAGARSVASAPDKTSSAMEVLVVPPYLDLVVFDVFRATPRGSVEVYPPGSATPLRAGAGGVESVGVGDVLATLVVPHPPPGQWLIRKSQPDARVRILAQQFFPRGMLVRPAVTDAPRQHDRTALSYQVLDSSGRPFEELPGYALSLEVSLGKPNGTSTLMPMVRDPEAGRAVFRTAQETDLDLSGRYWTDVRVTTVDADGRRLDVFRDRWSGFSVTPAARVDCRVSASGTAAWWPMATRIDCVAGERPVELSAIANGAPADLFRAVLFREGRRTDASLDLRYEGGGTFRGRLRGAARGGAYHLQLAAERTRLRERYNVRFLPPRLSFTRRTPLEWLLVPLSLSAIAAAWRRRKTKS